MKAMKKITRWITAASVVAALTLSAAPTWASTNTNEYDDLGRLTKVTFEDGSTISYEYDPAGNITRVEETPAAGGGSAPPPEKE